MLEWIYSSSLCSRNLTSFVSNSMTPCAPVNVLVLTVASSINSLYCSSLVFSCHLHTTLSLCPSCIIIWCLIYAHKLCSERCHSSKEWKGVEEQKEQILDYISHVHVLCTGILYKVHCKSFAKDAFCTSINCFALCTWTLIYTWAVEITKTHCYFTQARETQSRYFRTTNIQPCSTCWSWSDHAYFAPWPTVSIFEKLVLLQYGLACFSQLLNTSTNLPWLWHLPYSNFLLTMLAFLPMHFLLYVRIICMLFFHAANSHWVHFILAVKLCGSYLL